MERQARHVPPVTSVQPGDSIMIEGIARLVSHEEKPGVTVTLGEDTLLIQCRAGRFPRALLRFLQQRAADIMTPLAYVKAAEINKAIHSIAYRDTKSRWGSCASNGRLSFSWRLIMAPPEIIDYLVAHEVAHLQYMDHSKNFWALCRALTPHATVSKHWLKQHGAELHQLQF